MFLGDPFVYPTFVTAFDAIIANSILTDRNLLLSLIYHRGPRDHYACAQLVIYATLRHLAWLVNHTEYLSTRTLLRGFA